MFQIFHEKLETYCSSDLTVSVQQLTKFLIKEQGEKVDEKEVSRHMRDYLQDAQRNVQEPYFTKIEVTFFSFLQIYSKKKVMLSGIFFHYRITSVIRSG